MIRLADYIVRYLADHGIGHVLMVTGGAAMHLNDAFEENLGSRSFSVTMNSRARSRWKPTLN
jgi:thiamine pyrophosphate-dependent acetolactate synthase large subunit-like protein